MAETQSNAQKKAEEDSKAEYNDLPEGEKVDEVEVGNDATSMTAESLAGAQALSSAEAKPSSETFEKSIAIAVIADPETSLAKIDADPKLKKKVKNYVDLKKAPRGSLIVKALADKVGTSYTVAFPFFQSHLMLPVSIGEAVWTITLGGRVYWFSRIAGSAISEDVNHTHVDRDMSTPVEKNPNAKDKDDKVKGKIKNFIGKFLPGGSEKSGREGTKDAGAQPQNIFKEPILNGPQLEVVPRFTPKAGDLVLQGSHNTLISLGTDRGWNKLEETFKESNANDPWEEMRGTIDLVVGRGSPDKDAEEIKPTTEKDKGTDPTRTVAPQVVTELGTKEANKQSKINETKGNPVEGDPDFHTDLSRIYISMKSPIDERLTLSEQSPVLAGSVPLEDQEDACIALKTNQIRIVAREEGSIRIVKEGDPEAGSDDTTRASFIIQPDGSIHLVGQQIFLGKSKDEGGHPDNISGPFEPGAMQPYILFSVMKEYLEAIHKSIDGFCQTLSTHTTPGYGSPSPQINQAAAKLKSDMKKHQEFIDKLASQRIFGE